MTISSIAIKGNFANRITEVFECFRYKDLISDRLFDNAAEFNAYLSDNYFDLANNSISLRGIWFDNGWTIISDPETVDTMDEEALLLLSNKLDTEILTFIIQSTSGAFGFAKYYKTTQRYFFAVAGEETEDIGLPLHEEEGLNLDKHVGDDALLKLANNFGIDLDGKGVKSFVVKQMGYNDELKKELESFKKMQKSEDAGKKKSWWKLW